MMAPYGRNTLHFRKYKTATKSAITDGLSSTLFTENFGIKIKYFIYDAFHNEQYFYTFRYK
jgi:hypothetical protein